MRFSAYFLVLLIIVGSISACRRKQDTIVEITVRDSNNQLVVGANVRIYPEPTDSSGGTLLWDYESISNSAGVATFNFNEIYQLGQSGVVVANIEARKDSNLGTAIIRVEQETTSTETVFI